MASFEHLQIRGALDSDLEELIAFVESCGLRSSGIAEHPNRYVIARDSERIVASSGVEMTRKAALIRSVAVLETCRGTGLGRRMVREILDRITFRGVREIYLLTETAETFFEERGFHRIEKEQIPKPFLKTSELQGCTENATCMRLLMS